jgi:hypothetical protein
MFTVIYIAEVLDVGVQNAGTIGEHTYDLLPYELRVSRRIWRTREAAQSYADGNADDRKAFVVQLPETYTLQH